MMGTLLQKFFDLVKDQFSYGGKKYALTGEKTRESTDVLFDQHGASWLFGTSHKYCFRYKNLKRERDLLKIATYQFITWLKRGFFCKLNGTMDAIDTSLMLKDLFFPQFCKIVEGQEEHFEVKGGDPIQIIGNLLSMWSDKPWEEIAEDEIITVFLLAFKAWESDFGENGGKDKDTWLEK